MPQYIIRRPTPATARLLLRNTNRYGAATPQTARPILGACAACRDMAILSRPLRLFQNHPEYPKNAAPNGNRIHYDRGSVDSESRPIVIEDDDGVWEDGVRCMVSAQRYTVGPGTDNQARTMYTTCRDLAAAMPGGWDASRIDWRVDPPAENVEVPTPGQTDISGDTHMFAHIIYSAQCNNDNGRAGATADADEYWRIGHGATIFYGCPAGYKIKIPLTVRAEYAAQKNAPQTFGASTQCPELDIAPRLRVIAFGPEWQNAPTPLHPPHTYTDIPISLNTPLHFPAAVNTGTGRSLTAEGTVEITVPPSRTVAFAILPFENLNLIHWADTFLGRLTVYPLNHHTLADTRIDLSVDCTLHLGELVL